MNLLFIFLNVIFFLLVVRSVFFWTSLWQTKEYRLDRILTHFKETSQGKKLFFSPFLILKLLAIFSYSFVVADSKFQPFFTIFVFFLFCLELFSIRKEFLTFTFKRPVFTFKAKLVIFLTLFFIFVFFFFPLVDYPLWMLILDRLVSGFTLVFVFLLSFPSDFYKDIRIEKAIKIINKHKKLLVIGVTGSYGKSSTKDFIAQILAYKYNVVKTLGTNNTLIGIADTIITGLKKETQIFVVEMGAYKKGEISEICQVVHPKIGIITAVNCQHLSLFGKIENTMEAKYELINSLPKDGIALFNANNENAYLLFKKAIKENLEQFINRKIIRYNCYFENEEKELGRDLIYAFNIKVKKEWLEFDVLVGKKTFSLKTILLGIHNVENILPAVFIAINLGLTVEEIQQAVLNLTPLPKTMSSVKLVNGAIGIDDTFNANPQAVIAALNYMKLYRGKRILVLQPMIELGRNGKLEHLRIAEEISKVCNILFLTNKNYYKTILKEIENSFSGCQVIVANPIEIAGFLKRETQKNDIIVFEGKESSFSLSKLL